jgi:hypothetical protein
MHIFQHEMDTMVFSNFDGVFVFPHLEDVQTICLHIDLAYVFSLLYLCCANCVVNKNGHVLDDMLPYHAHILFLVFVVHRYTCILLVDCSALPFAKAELLC